MVLLVLVVAQEVVLVLVLALVLCPPLPPHKASLLMVRTAQVQAWFHTM